MALAATLGFAVAILFRWEFSFLTPMLAFQMLGAMPVAPGLRQGLAIPLVIFLATNVALVASTLFLGAPFLILVIIGLIVCWTFYGQRRGAPAIFMLLIQISICSVPLFSTVSIDLGHELAEFLQRSSIAAIAIVWISHALIPALPTSAVAAAPAKPPDLEPRRAALIAISDTLVLLPLLVNFMMGSDTSNFVILVTSLNLLREVDPSRSRAVALGLLAGNVFGGVVAVVAQQFVLLADSFALFLLTVLLAGLWFCSRLVRGGPTAPIFALAFTTFLMLLGLAITPLPGGSEEMFVVRILKIGLASLYVIGALALVTRLREKQ